MPPAGRRTARPFPARWIRRKTSGSPIKQALELDPFSATIESLYAVDLAFARRYHEAIVQARKTLELQLRAPLATNALPQALAASGMNAEALVMDEEVFANNRELLAALARGYAEAGYPGLQRALAAALAARFGMAGGASRARTIARRYLRGGDKERALGRLEKAYEGREPQLPYMCFPVYDSIRSDPRFQSLLRRMKLPQ